MPPNSHCPYCTEPIARGERATWVTPWSPRLAHYECAYRQMVGSVNAQLGLEKRRGGPDSDPSEVVPREDALSALRHYRERRAKAGSS